MNYDLIIQKAIEFATKAHAGQKRKDGKDYITHLISVMEFAVKDYDSREEINPNLENRAYIALLSLSHDGIEDLEKYKNNSELFVNELDEHLGFVLSRWQKLALKMGLNTLNKNNYPNYFEYIKGVKKDYWATIVKLADLKHNQSDLAEGTLKDKYRLAEYILTN